MSNKVTSIQIEHVQDILDTDGLNCLLQIMKLKVDLMGNSLLTEDLSKVSFASLGIATAKYQGAKELLKFIEHELEAYKLGSGKSK